MVIVDDDKPLQPILEISLCEQIDGDRGPRPTGSQAEHIAPTPALVVWAKNSL
jgi:hypothetical protein